jgi:hypothetical protein
MAPGSLISVSYNEHFAVPGVTASGLSWDDGARVLAADEVMLESGAFTLNLPTSPNPYPATGGGSVMSYFDDFYNRIFIDPLRIDFGSISENTSANIDVWNAYYKQTVTLTGLTYDSSAGLSLDGGGTPLVFAPLQSRGITVTAGTNGSAILDENLVFSFDLPWVYELPISGFRARMWAFEPNWPPSGQSYQVTYSFLTEILNSRSGKEQRIALRGNPRKSLSHECLLHGEQFRAYKDLMWYWQHRAFVTPELTRFVDAPYGMASGSNELLLDTVPAWLVANVMLVLQHLSAREIRVVESVAAGLVTFKTTSGVDWPVGTRLYAGLGGNLATSISADRRTNNVAEMALRFDVTPLSEVWPEPPAAPATFNGRELFLKRPNWAQAVNSSMSHEIDEIDYDRGAVFRATPVVFGAESRKAGYLNRNAAEATELLDFFRRMRGRQGEFYMPTWEYDFEPKVAAAAGSTAMRVAGTGLATSYGASTVQKGVFILLNSGALITRKVLSVQPVVDGDGSDSVITVDGTWGTTISSDTIVMSGWLPVWRLSSDALTFEWLTNAVAQVQMTMQTLEDLAVETA